MEAYQEFLQKRCEEITENDKTYIDISNDIMKAESEIRKLVSDEVYKKLREYEELNLSLIGYVTPLIYHNCIKDIMNLK